MKSRKSREFIVGNLDFSILIKFSSGMRVFDFEIGNFVVLNDTDFSFFVKKLFIDESRDKIWFKLFWCEISSAECFSFFIKSVLHKDFNSFEIFLNRW